MTSQFDLNTFKKYYSSLLEHICSNKEFTKSCSNVSNIWKTTDPNFIRLLRSFFSKQPEYVKTLMPSSNLYTAILLFCEKNNDEELLNWTKSFNNSFLSSVAKALKKNRTEDFDFDKNLDNIREEFVKLKLRNEYLEKAVNDLQIELQLSQDKNAFLSASIEGLADEECEIFRKRMRSKIYSLNIDQPTTV
jgi:hypothetical protein